MQVDHDAGSTGLLDGLRASRAVAAGLHDDLVVPG
jgi:hypothetical protein